MDPIVPVPQRIEVSAEAALILMALSQRGNECQIVQILQWVTALAHENKLLRKPATVEFQVPEDLVKNIKGKPEEQDCLLLVHIPRVVFNEITDPSPIVAPDGGAPAGPRRLIVPG